MIFITQGSGYSAALDYHDRKLDAIIIDLNNSPHFDGMLPKASTTDCLRPEDVALNFSNGSVQRIGDIGVSPLGFSVNSYSDLNLRIAQALKMKIPALYKQEPHTPATKIGASTWLEEKPGVEYSVRGYWDGTKFGMFALTGRWNKTLTGDVGPILGGAICTGFSILEPENPLKLQFDLLAEYIIEKKDRFRGPVYLTVIDDGSFLWYKDIYFGFRFPEEYVLTRLSTPEGTYLGGNIAFGKGYALAMAVTLYDKDSLDLDSVSPAEARLDYIRADGNKVIPNAFKVGYVVGKDKTFADAAEDAVGISRKICPNFGYRTDAGKRAKEWYYHVRKRIKG